ncbi:MAG: hypothetical protein AAF840_13275, partial [Bacteroidota bacterium]
PPSVRALPSLPIAKLRNTLSPPELTAKRPVPGGSATLSLTIGPTKASQTTTGWSGATGEAKVLEQAFYSPQQQIRLSTFRFHLGHNYNTQTQFRLNLRKVDDLGPTSISSEQGIVFEINGQKGWHEIDLYSLGIEVPQAFIATLTVVSGRPRKENGGLFFSHATRKNDQSATGFPTLAWHFTAQ